MPKKSSLSKEQLDESGFVASYVRDAFTYCCGGIEIGGLECYDRPRWVKSMWEDDYHENTVHKTIGDAWKDKLDEMRGDPGRPVMFNVIEAETPELAELLRKTGDCIEILKWHNPNTHNIITMFILTNGADESYKENYWT